MQVNGTLIIRADANEMIGTGHVMRCLALGQAWKDAGGQVVFVTATRAPGLLARLRSEGFYVRELDEACPAPGDWVATSQVLHAYPGSWVVLDGYHFDEAYQRRVKEAGHPLLVIDDMAHLSHYYADIVLNQNLHAEQLDYHCEPYTRLLLGTRYVLLRREFLKWRGWKREIPEVARKVLVTLGGSDPDNVSMKVIQALEHVDVEGLEVVVVVGPANPHYEELQAAAARSPISIRIEPNAPDMPSLMVWADAAVSSAGTAVWEMAYMGLPFAVGITSPAEDLLVSGIMKYRQFVILGWFNRIPPKDLAAHLNTFLYDADARVRACCFGRRLVSGDGCSKAIEILAGETWSKIEHA